MWWCPKAKGMQEMTDARLDLLVGVAHDAVGRA